MKWFDSLKNTDKQAILGIVGEKKFQEKIDTVVSGIKVNERHISKSYNELLAVAKRDLEIAEKMLVAKIVTSVYNKTKDLRKKYKNKNLKFKDAPTTIVIDITKWNEFKTLYKMFDVKMSYPISFNNRINDILAKYNLCEFKSICGEARQYSDKYNFEIVYRIVDCKSLYDDL